MTRHKPMIMEAADGTVIEVFKWQWAEPYNRRVVMRWYIKCGANLPKFADCAVNYVVESWKSFCGV